MKRVLLQFNTTILAILIAILVITFNSKSNAQSITKVEPPNWWVGMQNDTVQLMVYGKDLKDMQFTLPQSNCKIVNVYCNDNDYAFLDLQIPKDAKPTTLFIKLDKGKYHFTISYQLQEKRLLSTQRI